MRSNDVREGVGGEEAPEGVLAEVAGRAATGVRGKAIRVLRGVVGHRRVVVHQVGVLLVGDRVVPEDLIGHRGVGDRLQRTGNGGDLRESRLRGNAPVGAVDGLVDDGHQRHHIEDGVEGVEDGLRKAAFNPKLLRHLIVEGVLPLQLAGLVVAAQQVHSMRGDGLHAEQVEDALHRVGAPVDVVAEEEEVAAEEVDVGAPDVHVVGEQVGEVAVDV